VFLFGGNVAVEKLGASVEIANQCTDPCASLNATSFAFLK
jgi:hypothetical protein